MVLALVDLDRFREINDTLGHELGDHVLRQVSTRIATALADERTGTGTGIGTGIGTVTVAHIGGDEFAFVAATTGEQAADELAAAVSACLEAPIEAGGVEIVVAATIGAAVAPTDGEDVATLVRHADVALGLAKRTHATYRRYDEAADTYRPERFQLAADLRRAIDAGELFLAYQPKVGFRDHEIHGVEALVRWQHPERGLVSPGEFLPAIEHTELIGPLTYHLLELALAQWRSWHEAGLDIPIAVNLSARSVTDPELPSRIAAALERHGAPPSALELELTESAVLADPDEARAALGALSDLGVRIAVDDFGTGYASLAYLISLPVDIVKIDMSFARVVTTDPHAAAIVRFTVDLARQLGLEVVAEGVEDATTFIELGRLGCDLAQGYHVTRPLPADELTAWFVTADYPTRRATPAERSRVRI